MLLRCAFVFLAVLTGCGLPAGPALAQSAPGGQHRAAEARLIDIYRLIGRADTALALQQASQLVADYPNFALAQLVYADVLAARTRPVKAVSEAPGAVLGTRTDALTQLRLESGVRIKALQERPPAGAVPAPFLRLSPSSRHAIAVDASRSRLYLFENRTSGLTLVDDYYVSVGKLGVDKSSEGDQRTPLGVYFITSQLNPKALTDFYGSGALPISYPNVLDARRGKTGSGIWLHGTPPGQFSRPPQASDGCVVLANPDLERLMRTVAIRSTPVVIARQLNWVTPQQALAYSSQFESRLHAWRQTKSRGDLAALNAFYAVDFGNGVKTRGGWLPQLQRELTRVGGRELEIKDLSLLHWHDTDETMVVTFGEVPRGQRSGSTKRQYWGRQDGQWRIFYEGVI